MYPACMRQAKLNVQFFPATGSHTQQSNPEPQEQGLAAALVAAVGSLVPDQSSAEMVKVGKGLAIDEPAYKTLCLVRERIRTYMYLRLLVRPPY